MSVPSSSLLDARHVVALSGGKDSSALALRLQEVEPRAYEFVCTPTGDELPDMADHWKRLEDLIGQPLIRIPEMTLKELVQREKMLPNWQARFCTHRLKIVPFERHVCERLPVTCYVGLRADEDDREGVQYGIELLVKTRFPLREWGWRREDVERYLLQRRVTVPRRTDCARCPLQTLNEWWRLWSEHRDIYEDACREEDQIGHSYRSPGRDTWPARLRDLATRFEDGDVPKVSPRAKGGCRVCTL